MLAFMLWQINVFTWIFAKTGIYIESNFRMTSEQLSGDYDPFTVQDEDLPPVEAEDEFDQANYQELLKTWARDEGKTITKRKKSKTLFDQRVKKTEQERVEYTKIRLSTLKQAFESAKVDLTEAQKELKDVAAKVKRVKQISSLSTKKWTAPMRRFIAEQDGKSYFLMYNY